MNDHEPELKLIEDGPVQGGPQAPRGPASDANFTFGDLDVSSTSESRRPRRSGSSWLPWTLLVLLIAGIIAAVMYVGLPMKARLDTAEADRTRLNDELGKSREVIDGLKAERDTSEADRARLAEELTQKSAALEEVQHAQDELAKKLEAEIKKGEVLVSEVNGQLTVDVSDRILFDSGEADLNESGKEVLKRVGETLIKLENKVLQVGGHTDAVPISEKLVGKFASNWELSAARATNVVRFLQDEVKVPGERLVAAGFSQYRPTASNATPVGRKRNRRIEIALLPLPVGKRH